MIHNFSLKAVRSDGLTFIYESDDWRVLSITGIDAAEIEVSKEARGIGDGAIITGKRRLQREVTIAAKAQNYEARIKAQGFHNNRYTYDLYVTYNGVTRIAKDCELTGKSIPTKNIYKKPDLTVKFLSPHADLFAVGSEQTNFSRKQALWAWPHVYRANKPLNFARSEVTTEKIINYIGSSPAKPIIEITSTGYVKDVLVKVNNNIAVLDIELKAGDRIVIDTSNSYALVNNKILSADKNNNIYDFRKFLLDFGDNIIKVDAVTGSNALRTNVMYVGRYDGL